MSKLASLLFAFLALLPLASSAEEQAFTNRATDLKERAAADARTIASLPENTAVKVLARSGGWTQVDASGKSGWLRVFHLRFPGVVEASSGSSGGSTLAGLGSALGFGRSSPKATVATTGVRGLSPEDLKNAAPDAEAVRRLQSYRADRATAERFARDAKLAAVNIDEPPGAPR